MPPVGFEPTISVGKWPQAYALDRAATGTGSLHTCARTNSVELCLLWGHKEKTNYTGKHILQGKKEILPIRLQYLEPPIKEFLLLAHSRCAINIRT